MPPVAHRVLHPWGIISTMTSSGTQGHAQARSSAVGLLLGLALATLFGVAIAKQRRQPAEGTVAFAGDGFRPVVRPVAVPSPGGWQPPPGALPAWNWIPPEHGLSPRMDRVPWWVRLWWRAPILDRFAYAWMWDHGGWDVVPHVEVDDVPVGSHVRTWHAEEGWGVVDSPDTPGGCWVHFSHIQSPGYRELLPGQSVALEWEKAEQDGFEYRATSVTLLSRSSAAST